MRKNILKKENLKFYTILKNKKKEKKKKGKERGERERRGVKLRNTQPELIK